MDDEFLSAPGSDDEAPSLSQDEFERQFAQVIAQLLDQSTRTPPQVKMGSSTKFKTHAFDRDNADMFFGGLESQFTFHKITDEFEMYSILVGIIDYKEMDEKSANMIRKRPDTDPYTSIKTAILESFKPSNYAHTKSLLKKEQLGDAKPSDFLARLTRIGDPEGESNPVVLSDVLEIWIHALPVPWHTTLLAISDRKEAGMKADILSRWQHNPKEAAAYREATGVDISMPVAALSNPFLPAAHVAAMADNSDLANRMTRMERSLADISIALLGTKNNNATNNNNANNNNRYKGNNYNPNHNNERQQDNNTGQGKKEKNHFQRTRDRSQSPARVNSGLCLAHSRYGEAAYSCREYCTQWNTFQSKQGSNPDAVNFQGRP
jgi:hypothetical protein